MDAEKILQSLEDDWRLVPPEFQDWWKNYLKKQYSRYLDTLSFLDKSELSDKILEIGSVPGHFTVLIKELGYDVRGIDIDPSRVEAIWNNYNIPVDKIDIEKDSLPFPTDSFDIIFFTEMLEHLRVNPLHALVEMYRVLRPSGRVILSTPNITPLLRLEFLLGRSYQGDPVKEFKKLEWLGHMGHIRLYSYQEVKRLLESVGFRLISRSHKGHLRGGWKAKLLMLLCLPKLENFRSYLYVVATKSELPA